MDLAFHMSDKRDFLLVLQNLMALFPYLAQDGKILRFRLG